MDRLPVNLVRQRYEEVTVHDGGVKPHAALWDDEAFVRRVAALAAARGLTVREACRGAGLAADYLNKPAGRAGRSVEAMWRLASVLNVKRSELIGVDDESEPASDATLKRLAYVADIAAHLYVALSGRDFAPVGAEKLVSEIMQLARRAA